MFIYRSTGKGVINGKWEVGFYTMKDEFKIVKFFDEEYLAAEHATFLNNSIRRFLEILLK